MTSVLFALGAFALAGGARMRAGKNTGVVLERMLSGFPKVPRLALEVHETDPEKREEGCRAVARALCEEMAEGEISIRTLQGGLTNQLYLLTAAQNPSAQVLVRIYGINTEVIIDRDIEEVVFHILSHKGFGPKLYGVFENGRVEGFVPCKPVEPPMMGLKTPVDLPTMIASELARMHELEMPLPRNPHLWSFLHKFGALCSGISLQGEEQKRLEALELGALRRRLALLEESLLPSVKNGHGKQFIDNAKSDGERLALKFLFEPVFCHNDLLAGNILLLEGRVQLIDFEYGKYNYRGFDFGNHFDEYAGFDFNLAKWYPNADAQRYFISKYIAAMSDSTLHTRLSQDAALADDFYKVCHDWCNRFAESANFMWGFWALIQKLYSPIQFDYLDYARLRLSPIPR